MSKRVLFVCLGNICRSPAAEAVMNRFAQEYDVDVQVDSAGTHDYQIDQPADPRMVAAAEARGYELTSRGRQVTAEELEEGRYDLVLAMDSENHAFLQDMAGEVRPHVRMFSDFLDDQHWPADVPDPYYGEADGFETVLDMLEEGCPVILQSLVGEAIHADEFADDEV